MKQIGLALHNYHQAFGCFPPAYVTDAQGRPMHSWRVLLLPFLDQQAIYNRYCFDEPWDGPNNRKLHDLAVSAYTCPSHAPKDHATAYAAIIGPATAWPGAAPRRLDEVTDGTSQTILVAEIATPSIHWMEPSDLRFDRMSFAINGPNNPPGLSSKHPGIANVLMADGSIRALSSKWMTPETLRALLTIARGDAVGDF